MSAQNKPTSSELNLEKAKRDFQENGYVVFRNVVDQAKLADHTQQLFDKFNGLTQDGPLFGGGGGMIMGHLNCFPGEASRFVYDSLKEQGYIDLVAQLMPRATGLPNVGCNFNLPRSTPQNYHVDGYAETAFPILNIASVDTNLGNGAFDTLARTHNEERKYWQIIMDKPISKRLPMAQGDIMIRTSMLWHRGMSNHSCHARPMLALSWEDGGSSLPDPYRKNDGEIAFYPNRFNPNLVGRLREQAYALAPGLHAGARFVQSLLR